MTYTTNDEIKDLIINTMPRAVFEDLSAKGQIDGDQIYFIEDEGAVDVNGEQITNLKEPTLSSDAATKNYVDTEIAKIDVSEQLTGYQLKGDYLSATADHTTSANVSAIASAYAADVRNSLTAYETKDDLTSNYYRKTDVTLNSNGQIKVGDVTITALTAHQSLDNYYAKSQTSSAQQIAAGVKAVDDKLSGYALTSQISAFSDVYVNGVKSNLSVRNISDVEYYGLSEEERAISNLLYVVSSENENFFGERLQNVGEPQISSDAATKNYVDTEIAKIDVSEQLTGYQLKGDYLSATADHTTSAQVSAIVEGYTSKMVTIRKWSD